MGNKTIQRELIWLALAFVLTLILMLSLLHEGLIVSNEHGKPDLPPPENFNLIRLVTFCFLFFPILFILNSFREIKHRFQRQPQHIYLIFITLLSLISTGFILSNLRSASTFLWGSWKVYPPLSQLQNEINPPDFYPILFWSIVVFLIWQLLVFIYILSKLLIRYRNL